MKAAKARVVLTGASGGIGRAVAARLVRSGAAVMLVGRSAARLAGQARELASSIQAGTADDARIAWHIADVTQSAALRDLADAAAQWSCNVIVHGAGVPAFGAFADIDAERVRALVETNLIAPMRLTQALLPHLREQPRAQVVCIGSALGRIGVPGFAVYGATKFGLRGFAEALRRELADTQVRVQYLGPRSTRTAFNDEHVASHLRATGAAVDPPERVAAALLQLVESERPERYVGYPESLAVRVNALASGWLDAAFRKHLRSLHTHRSAGRHP
jgi:short-subunit dehydrogenase